jgi:hypothetical protein
LKLLLAISTNGGNLLQEPSTSENHPNTSKTPTKLYLVRVGTETWVLLGIFTNVLVFDTNGRNLLYNFLLWESGFWDSFCEK